MKLYKRCDCEADAGCDHHYWYRFSLHRREHRGSTYTANRDLANRIAIKRQGQTLETHEKLRKLKTVKLSEHATAYAEMGREDEPQLAAERSSRPERLSGDDRRSAAGRDHGVPRRALEDAPRQRGQPVQRQP